MNWQQMSAIADAVAAVAVILSLSFLAWEVRAYARQAREDSMDLVTSRRHELLRILATDSELASLVWRGFAGVPRLPAHEWARFGMYLYTVVLEYERAWIKAKAGSLDKEVMQAWDDALVWWMKHPGVRAWWSSNHPGFSPGFSAYINAAMEGVAVDAHAASIVAASFREHEARLPASPAAELK